MIRGWFSNDLLVEISAHQLRVSSFTDGRSYRLEPWIALKGGKILDIGTKARLQNGNDVVCVNPFSHPRVGISSFTYAEKIVRHAIRELHGSRFFDSAPRVVMHQLDKTEGGLTEIEIRVLKEIAIGAGARDVVVYSGPAINTSIASYEDLVEQSQIDT